MMRENVTMIGAVAAIWALAGGVADARCDLTDAAAMIGAGGTPDARREVQRLVPPPVTQTVTVVRREAPRAPPRREACAGRTVCPPTPVGAIPDSALMRKRRIL